MTVIEKLKLGKASHDETSKIIKEYLNIVFYYSRGDLDLFSAGQAGLEYALRNADKIQGNNLRGWIFLCVRKFVARAQKKMPITEELLDVHTYTENRTLDDILDLCKNPTELEIVKKRVDGYNDGEISVQIGISKSAVHRIRMNIKVRFETK